eukprot:6622143-Pyramimonas_sp.AAC.1
MAVDEHVPLTMAVDGHVHKEYHLSCQNGSFSISNGCGRVCASDNGCGRVCISNTPVAQNA